MKEKANFEGNIQAIRDGDCYLKENIFKREDGTNTTLGSTSQVESIHSLLKKVNSALANHDLCDLTLIFFIVTNNLSKCTRNSKLSIKDFDILES
eukprot:Pgem_evm1s5799